jgi:hypothetical protein
LSEEFSDFIPVAVHNSDPMVNTEYDTWMSNSVGGYPSGHVQRRTVDVDPLGFKDAYNNAKAIPPSADMSMQFQYDEQTKASGRWELVFDTLSSCSWSFLNKSPIGIIVII